MDHMDQMHWPLSVLCKAVHFKNLTGASAHVGLSQPQLSRLISQLEKELSVILLDRSAKRKSGWTPAAHRLAEIYSLNARRLQGSIQEMLGAQVPTHLNIGTLEGLSHLATQIVHSILTSTGLTTVELDVYDQNELDQKFLNSELDLVFTARYPSKQKFAHVIELGHQSLDQVRTNDKFNVMSSFEFGRLKKKPDSKILVSNSLAIRKMWFDQYGGTGDLPSAVQKTKGKDLLPVLLLGSELFNETLWKAVVNASTQLK